METQMGENHENFLYKIMQAPTYCYNICRNQPIRDIILLSLTPTQQFLLEPTYDFYICRHQRIGDTNPLS